MKRCTREHQKKVEKLLKTFKKLHFPVEVEKLVKAIKKLQITSTVERVSLCSNLIESLAIATPAGKNSETH
jgi:hypothetical protein